MTPFRWFMLVFSLVVAAVTTAVIVIRWQRWWFLDEFSSKPHPMNLFCSAIAMCFTAWMVRVVVLRLGARRRAGVCHACGYDLRGLPAAESVGRCPECGEEPGAAR
ncbi:MAG: hypothetical protein ACKVZJ_11185 [Phycisphaerales bacterium]